MNPISPFIPINPAPPPREEPPTPVEPDDDIRKIGDKIGDVADDIAEKVGDFRDLLEDEQGEIDDAVETFREIGSTLESTGKSTRSNTEYNVSPLLPDSNLQGHREIRETSNQVVDDTPRLPWWAGWAVAGGLGVWGLSRKPK